MRQLSPEATALTTESPLERCAIKNDVETMRNVKKRAPYANFGENTPHSASKSIGPRDLT